MRNSLNAGPSSSARNYPKFEKERRHESRSQEKEKRQSYRSASRDSEKRKSKYGKKDGKKKKANKEDSREGSKKKKVQSDTEESSEDESRKATKSPENKEEAYEEEREKISREALERRIRFLEADNASLGSDRIRLMEEIEGCKKQSEDAIEKVGKIEKEKINLEAAKNKLQDEKDSIEKRHKQLRAKMNAKEQNLDSAIAENNSKRIEDQQTMAKLEVELEKAKKEAEQQKLKREEICHIRQSILYPETIRDLAMEKMYFEKVYAQAESNSRHSAFVLNKAAITANEAIEKLLSRKQKPEETIEKLEKLEKTLARLADTITVHKLYPVNIEQPELLETDYNTFLVQHTYMLKQENSFLKERMLTKADSIIETLEAAKQQNTWSGFNDILTEIRSIKDETEKSFSRRVEFLNDTTLRCYLNVITQKNLIIRLLRQLAMHMKLDVNKWLVENRPLRLPYAAYMKIPDPNADAAAMASWAAAIEVLATKQQAEEGIFIEESTGPMFISPEMIKKEVN